MKTYRQIEVPKGTFLRFSVIVLICLIFAILIAACETEPEKPAPRYYSCRQFLDDGGVYVSDCFIYAIRVCVWHDGGGVKNTMGRCVVKTREIA